MKILTLTSDFEKSIRNAFREFFDDQHLALRGCISLNNVALQRRIKKLGLTDIFDTDLKAILHGLVYFNLQSNQKSSTCKIFHYKNIFTHSCGMWVTIPLNRFDNLYISLFCLIFDWFIFIIGIICRKFQLFGLLTGRFVAVHVCLDSSFDFQPNDTHERVYQGRTAMNRQNNRG